MAESSFDWQIALTLGGASLVRDDRGLGQRWETALLLGILALATAPATTVLVLKETESEGPVTDYAKAFKMFKTSKDDCIPVVTPDEPHELLGILRRRDVLRLLIREQLDSS